MSAEFSYEELSKVLEFLTEGKSDGRIAKAIERSEQDIRFITGAIRRYLDTGYLNEDERDLEKRLRTAFIRFFNLDLSRY
jgi:DNA-binding NarL/FixJ family response regulator